MKIKIEIKQLNDVGPLLVSGFVLNPRYAFLYVFWFVKQYLFNFNTQHYLQFVEATDIENCNCYVDKFMPKLYLTYSCDKHFFLIIPAFRSSQFAFSQIQAFVMIAFAHSTSSLIQHYIILQIIFMMQLQNEISKVLVFIPIAKDICQWCFPDACSRHSTPNLKKAVNDFDIIYCCTNRVKGNFHLRLP